MNSINRGVAAAVFVAGLAAAGPAALAYADDIDNYEVSDTNTLSIFFGTQDYTWTDSTSMNAFLSVDDTTGKSVPVFNFPTVNETTTTLPSGDQAFGYADQNQETIFQGDTTTLQTSTSEIALETFPGGDSTLVWDPYSVSSETIVTPDSDTPPA